MIDKKRLIKALTKTLDKLRDTKYATCDIDERLALARMEVADLRAALLDARDGASADLCAAKLKSAEEEYRRVLRISRQRKAV